jgi:hypothetical protein
MQAIKTIVILLQNRSEKEKNKKQSVVVYPNVIQFLDRLSN